MAIDTPNKRRSSICNGIPGFMPPLPDGDLNTKGDRSHMAGVYRFALATLNAVQGIIGSGFGIGILSKGRRRR